MRRVASRRRVETLLETVALVNGVLGPRAAETEPPLPFKAMTAKGELRGRAEWLTTTEPEQTPRLLGNRADPLTRVLGNAPFDDEPTTPEEEAPVPEGFQVAVRGETISLEQLRAGFDAERR